MRTAKDDRQGILRPLPARLAGTILRLARDAIVADKLMWWMQGEGETRSATSWPRCGGVCLITLDLAIHPRMSVYSATIFEPIPLSTD